MAQITIAEARNLAQLPNNSGQCMQLPAEAEQVVSFAGGEAKSAAFGAGWSPALSADDGRTIIIRVNTDAACCVEVGLNPTATTSSTRLSANQTEFFGVRIGHKLSVIATN